ncbi:MAG: PQQ-binding-like beta-propeller repeat protein [Gemmatimonadota bacterium]|nr:MAG: PQQ-binding-like beta-propeller repeat protein [Gemmatimonadota bacterium]
MNVKVLLFPVALLCVSGQVFGQYDWPMVNGCREQTAWAENETELAPPFESKTFDNAPGGTWLTSDDGMLLFGQGNTVHAIDPQNDTLLWSFKVDSAGGSIGCAPAFVNSLVLCGGQGGTGLFALNRETGEEVWFKPIGSLYTRNPIPDGDRVYIIKDSLYCLDVADGSTVWSFPVSGQYTPAVDDSNVYTRGYALNKFTGEIKWQASFRGGLIMSVDNQYVYAEDGSRTIRAFRKSDGQIEWTYEILDGQLPFYNGGTAAVADDYFCFTVLETADTNSAVYVLDKATGVYLWHQVLDVDGIYPPSIANGIVYVTTWWNVQQLWGFDLATGDSIFFDDSRGHWYQPIIADRTLYVPSSGGLTAFWKAATSVEEFGITELPQTCLLAQNYPNPFNSTTAIEYQIADDRSSIHTTLKIYNLLGQEVRTLVEGLKEPGYYRVTWDGRDESGAELPSGVYFYHLKSGTVSETKQMVFLK